MIVSFLQSVIRFSTVFLYGAVGETITEKSGNLNLGIPGIMCMGGAGGVIGGVMYINSLPDPEVMTWAGAILAPVFMSMFFALLGGLIYSFLTVTLRCNQNVTGLALTTFGIGFLAFVGSKFGTTYSRGMSLISRYFRQSFSFAADLEAFGQLFFSYGILVYSAIIIAIITAVIIKKTRTGLNLRAVGENPATADAAGISVTKYKYGATLIGSMIAGLGGLFYIIDKSAGNIEYTIDTYGWMAVALVIFTIWRTNWAILGSLIFAMLYLLPTFVAVSFAQMELIKMVPYLVTIIVLIITSIRNGKEKQPPASLGTTYFREER